MNSELAPTEDQGVIFGIIDAPANATIEQTSAFADAAEKDFLSFPETNFTFQLTFPSSGFGGMVFKPWGKRKETPFQLLPEVQKKLAAIPGIQMFPVMPPALPGGGQFPVEFVILSTAEPEQMLGFAKQLQAAAMKSGKFAFPPLIDTKIDQPQSEIVIDHDKAAAIGLNLQQVGADLSAMMGGNFVNRFDIAGRAYKVIPQIKRVDRLNPRSVGEHLRHRTEGKIDPAQHHCDHSQQGGSPLAEPVAAAQRGYDQRRFDRADRSGAQGSGKRSGHDSAEGLLG